MHWYMQTYWDRRICLLKRQAAMVSLPVGARKWGDCTRARVKTAVMATVRQFNSLAVLPPPPLLSEGKWLPEVGSGPFRQCRISCYFMCVLLPRAPSSMYFSSILQFGSFILLIAALEIRDLQQIDKRVVNRLDKIWPWTFWWIIVSCLDTRQFLCIHTLKILTIFETCGSGRMEK